MKNKTLLIVGVILFLVAFLLGFFTGSAYKQHQIKKNIQSIFSGFGTESNDKKANVRNQEEKKIELNVIQQGEEFVFESNDAGKMAVSIYETINAGDKYSSDDWSEYTANNKLWVVRVAGKNIGTKPTSKYLGDFNLLLQTADGKQYRPRAVEQVNKDKRPEGYLGCVSCANNPGDKSVEDVIFDINEENVDGAKLVFEEDNIAFEL